MVDSKPAFNLYIYSRSQAQWKMGKKEASEGVMSLSIKEISGVPSQSVKRHTLASNKVSGRDNAKLFRSKPVSELVHSATLSFGLLFTLQSNNIIDIRPS